MQSRLTLIKTSSLILFLVSLSYTGFAQKINMNADLLLVDSVSKQQVHHSEKRIYIYKNQPKTFRNSNPVSLMYGGSLYVYQNFVSQHFSANCLYDPSCSDFSKLAVKEFGLIKGTLLSFDRLSRCNRISATDLDPNLIDKKIYRFSDSVKRYK
jgi:putative component of membrane protein insertase Oxa1/YidC/SpoIIIJ protein YidD